MITAILIILAFNTGLLLLSFGAIAVLSNEVKKSFAKQTDIIESDIEALGTAMFNMDSIKQKVNTSGRFEV